MQGSSKDYRYPLLSSAARQKIFLAVAQQAAIAIKAASPDARVFLFGSSARQPPRVGINSDIDLMVIDNFPADKRASAQAASIRRLIFETVDTGHKRIPFDIIARRPSDTHDDPLSHEVRSYGQELF